MPISTPFSPLPYVSMLITTLPFLFTVVIMKII